MVAPRPHSKSVRTLVGRLSGAGLETGFICRAMPCIYFQAKRRETLRGRDWHLEEAHTVRCLLIDVDPGGGVNVARVYSLAVFLRPLSLRIVLLASSTPPLLHPSLTPPSPLLHSRFPSLAHFSPLSASLSICKSLPLTDRQC